jgi:hypothetical protein
MQKKYVILSDYIVTLWLAIVAELSQLYCWLLKYLHYLLFFTTANSCSLLSVEINEILKDAGKGEVFWKRKGNVTALP